ncbi:MAG TPA: SDR family oxidoreductase [Microbacteriaceae bacterium]|nr:SDR family oxidoreductase [Microbacteriaceae bacterium]
MTLLAVVTGASTGIGAATARALRAEGWNVIAVARRAERLESLAEGSGVIPFAADLTNEDAVANLATFIDERGGVDALVHVAGGARGGESVEAGSIADWQWMFEANVLATKRLTSALLPLMRRAARERGVSSLVTVTSTAAFAAYPGGGGYNAAKFAEHAMVAALRLELAGEPIRVIEVAPGMVKTEEFALNRLGGDAAAAAAVYEGVEEPLTAADVAEVIADALRKPKHVNLDLIVLRPVAQAAQHLLIRQPLAVKDDA